MSTLELDDYEVDEIIAKESAEREIQTKKLMTVVKSKYFMLKANFPKEAIKIDSQPILESHEPQEQ